MISRKCNCSIGGSDADRSQDREESELHVNEIMLGSKVTDEVLWSLDVRVMIMLICSAVE